MALFTYDRESPTSSRDTVRFLIHDTDGSVTTGRPEDWTFYLTDGEIDLALSLSSSDVYLAAARCCLSLAANDLCVNRAVSLGQFSTSNEAVDYWRKLAADLQAQASLNAGADTAEVAWDEFSAGELAVNKALRGESN